MLQSANRNAFRKFQLDGALLQFHPATGTHIRIENAETYHLQRQAPRVVMFGITNKCNLSCDFCSRDVSRDSAWTVASATQVLRDLAAAGTLEVAFGGGEPFAFRGFAELITHLHDTTALALNVTTNGTLIDAKKFLPFAGRFGQVRVSIYDDIRWRESGKVLSSFEQKWGVNLIVDSAVLSRLPALLADLAQLGCHDISLLSYIGPDPWRHLSPRDRLQLAAIVQDSPIACRLSVCFGSGVPVDRLFDGADGSGDCGAGLDFVSITPDQRMQGCSFHEGGLPATSAEDIMSGWRHERARLALPSLRRGCARRETASSRASAAPSISVWQAFSGNNSGECVMVAKFQTVADAEAYLAQLLPSWKSEAEYPSDWKRLFREEAVAGPGVESGWSPREFAAIGRSVVAVGYDAADMFPELRALAWKKGGYVVSGGIHEQDAFLLAAVRARDTDDARAMSQQAPHASAKVYAHGDLILAVFALQGNRDTELDEIRTLLDVYAAGRPLAAEVVFDAADDASMLSVLKRLGTDIPRHPRLALHFGWNKEAGEKAARFAQKISEGQLAVGGGCVLISGIERRKRLAVFGYRSGVHVNAIDGLEVRIVAFIALGDTRAQADRARRQLNIDAESFREEIKKRFPSPMRIEAAEWWKGFSIEIHTTDPTYAFDQLEQAAQQLGSVLDIRVADTNPLAFAVRRVMAEVRPSAR